MTRATRVRRDSGSIAVWLVTSSFIMIVLAGLAIDLGGQVHAQQHARDVAAQAARAGGQVLTADAITGQRGNLDTARALAAARTYLAATDVAGTASLAGGDTVTVTTSATYTTTFLGVIGISSMTVTGHAQSRTQRALAGTER